MERSVSFEAFTSAAISVVLFACLVVSVGGHSTWETWTDWIFPSSMMCFAGWGVIFDLWLIKTERRSRAFVVDYGEIVPPKPMSPELTIKMLSIFWVQGMLLVVAVAHQAS